MHEAVFYYENDNGGNSNMAQPIDGGPGGGGILIDGGDQSTINYDANGNLTSYKGWVYHYDAQNRLIYASNGTTSATFCYDGKNRQIARNINGVIRFNSWDGWELVEEYSSSLNVATGYLQGTTGVIKSWSAANTLYYYQDKLGSTTHVANAYGQLVESYHYDLTGTPIETSTHGVVDLYAGERWIPELRLYDLRNRFMSPELGRFLQTDPIGFQGDASNLYRYCGNDPVDRTDPTGSQDEKPLHLDRIWDRQTWLQGGSNLSFANFELKKSEVRHGDGYGSSAKEAGLSREPDAKKIARGPTEAVCEIGRDKENPKQYYANRPRDGDPEVKNFRDEIKKDNAPVATSGIDPSRLPGKYTFVGAVLGMRLFSPQRAREDIQRAKNNHYETLIITAPNRKVPVIYDKNTNPNPTF